MRILIVDTYYPSFLESFYDGRPGLANESYEIQWQSLMNECFGTADFYSRNLRALGHDATEIVANCAPLQRSWVAERASRWRLREPAKFLRYFPRVWNRQRAEWLDRVLIAQVEAYRPDVIHFQDMPGTSAALLHALRPYVGAITGQIACEYSRDADFREYDLALSSFPHFVDEFLRQGLGSAYFRLGFEASLRDRLEQRSVYDAVFVGSISRDHRARIEFLETIARRVPIRWWGPGVENLDAESPLRRCHQGEAWGLRMYQTLSQARITLNFHLDIAGAHANNMRLYEATGAGSMLLTDAKSDLHAIFEPGREVAAFESADHCVKLLEHYLSNEAERSRIASSGLKRTLAEHTYRHRMEEYVGLVKPLLGGGRGAPSRVSARDPLRTSPAR